MKDGIMAHPSLDATREEYAELVEKFASKEAAYFTSCKKVKQFRNGNPAVKMELQKMLLRMLCGLVLDMEHIWCMRSILCIDATPAETRSEEYLVNAQHEHIAADIDAVKEEEERKEEERVQSQLIAEESMDRLRLPMSDEYEDE